MSSQIEYQDRVREAQYLLYKRKVPLIIVYEGWDAAGKGGNILRLTASMNPRGYEVVPVSRPNDFETIAPLPLEILFPFPESRSYYPV